MVRLLRTLSRVEASSAINKLLALNPFSQADLTDHHVFTDLISVLRDVGAASEVSELAIRAVDQCDISDTIAVVRLLRTLSRVEASSAINKLLALNPFSQADLTDHHVFTDLISVLRDVGAASEVSELAIRAVDHAYFSDPEVLARRIGELRICRGSSP